jgi:hypothetical protein
MNAPKSLLIGFGVAVLIVGGGIYAMHLSQEADLHQAEDEVDSAETLQKLNDQNMALDAKFRGMVCTDDMTKNQCDSTVAKQTKKLKADTEWKSENQAAVDQFCPFNVTGAQCKAIVIAHSPAGKKAVAVHQEAIAVLQKAARERTSADSNREAIKVCMQFENCRNQLVTVQ